MPMDVHEDRLAEACVSDLRDAVKAPEDEWRQRMNAIANKNRDPLSLQGMRAFLNSRLAEAKDPHRQRMTAMIAVLSTKLADMARDTAVVIGLVTRIAEFQDEISGLSGALRSAKNALAAMLGTAKKQTVGPYSVHVGRPHPYVRVLDRTGVPQAFLTGQPDRRLILQHFKSTGEVPAGIEIKETRPSVTVKLIGKA